MSQKREDSTEHGVRRRPGTGALRAVGGQAGARGQDVEERSRRAAFPEEIGSSREGETDTAAIAG